MGDFFYRFLSSRLAVGGTVGMIVLLVTAASFRIIPWWLFFTVLGVSGAGVVLYAIVSEWLALRRDKSFERGMGDQADAQMSRRKARDRDAVREMHDRWKEGLERLRKSRVGKRKQAIYFLPWYLIIGKPATGKTTAIKNSGLHFPLGMPKTAGTGGTRNCDWFFTEEAILLDTAGRYAQSDENEADKEEWIAFLRLVRKYRRDMPINGLLVAVAADDLAGKERDDVIADAQSLRNKLDELIKELGIQFPVYILVTKCDLVQGFTEFFGRLPKTRLTELLGWTNASWDNEGLTQRLEEAFTALRDRCRSFRPVFLNEETNALSLRNVYLFPEELEGLNRNLAVYCDTLFRQTQYADSPFLRGIYLTSGLQTGSTVSRMLGRLGLQAQAARVLEGSRSFFLQDFFQDRLKADQKLVAPTGKATVQFRIANNVALAGAIGACLLVAVLATASYVRNRTLLLSIQDSVVVTEALAGQPPAEQMALLDEYRGSIETLRHRNRNRSWLERFGLYSGRAVEKPVVNRFVRSYEQIGYNPALASADRALTSSEDATRAFDALDSLIGHLVLTKAAQGVEVTDGGELMAPWWNPLARDDGDARSRFAAAYRFYVREPWRPDGIGTGRDEANQSREQQLALVRDYLPRLLSIDEIRRWLANGQPVRAADYSLPSGGAGQAVVHPAFTPRALQQRIAPMLAALEQIQSELGVDVTSTFAQNYAQEYYAEWQRFVLGLRESSGSADYCGDKSPYLMVLGVAHDATSRPFSADLPAAPAGKGGVVPAAAAAPGAAGGASVFPGVEAPPWVDALGRVVGKKQEYIEKMGPACRAGGAGGDACAAANALSGGGPLETGVLNQAQQWVKEGMVGVNAATAADDRAVRSHVATLLNIPAKLAGRGALDECVRGMNDGLCAAVARFPKQPPWPLEELETAFSPGRGVIWQYCDETLGPYFNCVGLRRKPGIVRVPDQIVQFLGRADRFSRVFFESGGGWRTHTIAFESVPTTSKSDIRVTQTALTVSCSNTMEQPWEIRHRQTLERKSLSWRPDQCSEARLKVSYSPPGAAVGEERTVEIARPGSFGLIELLGMAVRQGNQFQWTFAEAPITAAFRISLPDATLAEATRIPVYTGCR